MKKVLSFALIILSLLSCVFFSACGDKYKKLKMDFYLSDGTKIDEFNYVIQPSSHNGPVRISIEFSNIDKDDIGQVKVYSVPNELIIDSNYSYNGKTCSVDITPVLPSGDDAKLVVSHLASGKKKEIKLNIEQKAQDLKLINSKYVVSIPKDGVNNHIVSFDNLVNLLPMGSTDEIYFKVINANLPSGVTAKSAEIEGMEDLCSGFEVGSETNDSTENNLSSFVRICPVTYLENYESEENPKVYEDQVVEIHFRHIIDNENLTLVPQDEQELDLNKLQLIANDNNNTYKLGLKVDDVDFINSFASDMYEISTSAAAKTVSSLVDAQGKVVVYANTFTEDYVEVSVVLTPIKFVGDIKPIEKTIKVKGEVCAEDIKIFKNEQELTVETTNIFDYYTEGNSLGSLFTFEPYSKIAPVHEDLKTMRILIRPEILNADFEKTGVNVVYANDDFADKSTTNEYEFDGQTLTVNSRKYSILLHKFNQPMKFYYDSNLGKMVSEPINETDRVYIKYVKGDGDVEYTDFGIEIQVQNNSNFKHWENINLETKRLKFKTVAGVLSMTLQAGIFDIDNTTYTPYGENPQYVYLNRLEGLAEGVDPIDFKYIGIENNSVKNVDNSIITNVQFRVEITPLDNVDKPLQIVETLDSLRSGHTTGFNSITHEYDYNEDADLIGLVLKKDTSIGDYKITFYQEEIERGSVICSVYEKLDEITKDMVSFETNEKAFENIDYTDEFEADYIVASGQNLMISINLPEDVLRSEIVTAFDFSNYTLGDDYFKPVQDKTSLNSALLQFRKGTFDHEEQEKQYVELTLKLYQTKFTDLVTKDGVEEIEMAEPIKFYIYEEIENSDISINHTSMTRYFKEYLGVYYENDSEAELEIQINDDLWDYVTIWDIRENPDEKIDWRIDNSDDDSEGVTKVEDKKAINLTFNSIPGYSNYAREVKAYLRQFDKVFEFKCVFYVEKPILTEKLMINSDVKVTSDAEDYYINLRMGDTYEVKAESYSSMGDVTHPEFVIQIADSTGSAYSARNYFEIKMLDDGITPTIKVIDIPTGKNFKLIVFAKDVLKYMPTSDKSGYNNPSSFIMDFGGLEEGKYKNAYFVIDIELSDGTSEHPYLITNENEFWEMDKNDAFKNAYFKVMNSFSIHNVGKSIEGFNGTITTYNNYQYVIDNIILDQANANLFTDFGGNISNLKFAVKYQYNNISNDEKLLGVFNVNNGLLANVSVEAVNGSFAKLNGSGIFYFGLLVGKNVGTITYEKVIGASGEITVSDSTAWIYLGGLVGHNVGKIQGGESEQVAHGGGTNEIVFNVADGRQDSMSAVEINITSQIGENSAVGGVVGLNTNCTINDGTNDVTYVGTIKNAYVQATIEAQTTNNVGGVIGENNQQAIGTLRIEQSTYMESFTNVLDGEYLGGTYKDVAICNVKSSSVINAGDRVGGIVGKDTNGLYIECDYQSLRNSTTQIIGKSQVGGIAGSSQYGKFAYCSFYSYRWNYNGFKESKDLVGQADLQGEDYVGGIIGYATSDGSMFSGGVVTERTVVAYSSVNAYMVSNNAIGGILSAQNSSINIIFNAYFIGKLEGSVCYDPNVTDDEHYLCLDNNGSSVYNAVYCLNVDATNNPVVIKTGNIKNGLDFVIDNTSGIANYWWLNTNINGGYIFVTIDQTANDNSLPIFDLAPEKIDVTVKDETNDALKKTLKLDYYDFTNNNITEARLLELSNLYNRYEIVNKLNFDIQPSGIGTVVLNVRSTNYRILDISVDGKLIVNGVGECDLIFSSMLNPDAGTEAERTIHVVIDYPIGDSFNITTSKTDSSKIVGGRVDIAKGNSVQYYVVTSGTISPDEGITTYKIKTKENPHLRVDISYETTDTSFNIEDYVMISGIKGVITNHNSGVATCTVNVDNKTPLIISVLKSLEEDNEFFNIKITPYYVLNSESVDYDTSTIKKEFKLYTKQGATSVVFSYDQAIVYPNDVVYLTAYITTDIELVDDPDTEDKNEIIELIKAFGVSIANYEIFINDSNYNNGIQTIIFRIEFKDYSISNEQQLTLQFVKNADTLAEVNYIVLPQRINKIEIKNYYKKNDEDEAVLDNILRPNYAGLMILDMVPDNGYFDYLEISDITGEEEIMFLQVDEGGHILSLDSDVSSDKKGIKLYAHGDKLGRIFVKTQIDKDYSSRIHTIEVRAYSSNDMLLRSNTKEIDVRMLPEITATYVLPNGMADSRLANSSEISSQQLLLANGVDASIKIETNNANGEVEFVRSGELKDKYEIVHEVGNFHLLKYVGGEVEADDVGKKITLTMRVYNHFDNGDFDIAECSFEFTIQDFVIHDVSVNSSSENGEDIKINGYYDKPIALNFYFDKDDISFYNKDEDVPFWDTQYIYKAGILEGMAEGPLKKIYTILEALNSYDTRAKIDDGSGGEKDNPDYGKNSYLILNDNNLTDGIYDIDYSETPIRNIELSENRLTVSEEYDPEYLAIAFGITDGVVGDITDDNTINLYNADGNKYIINKNYKLNFIDAPMWYKPTVVTNQQEFEKMSAGGRYILGENITLENYSPIDVELVEFDGNGRTIKIKSFAQFNEAEINAGLFKKVYENMIVKNVVVKYASTNVNGDMSFGKVYSDSIAYYDLCNNFENVNYTSAKFGGITPVNNGIITNCVVKGEVVLKASTIEQKKFESDSGYGINLFIGGMVAENTSTGYITNSMSGLKIISQANIGGFAYSNAGKIVSCGVENATIYGYNDNVDKTIEVDIAGFVVNNTNEISMSFVNFEKSIDVILDNINYGTMSAKNFSAGFAYANTGKIVDAYVQMSDAGVNNNTFAGFAYSNSGNITRAYTYINKGVLPAKDDAMFVSKNTGTIDKSIEFMVIPAGYSNGIDGLDTISITERNLKSVYEKYDFAFGDNESAVWEIQSGNMPQLVSTLELVRYTGDRCAKYTGLLPLRRETEEVDGGTEVDYVPNFAYYGTKENPYIIHDLESWKTYFIESQAESYYRIVKDIDFGSIGNNPSTSTLVFQGNIQGNNMVLDSIMLYSTSSLDSLGLFKELKASHDYLIKNSVRNLTLRATSVWASKTSAVGLLCGIAEDFNLYNINIDAKDVIMVGGNVVGGVAGLIRGEFDIDLITSNIGANSTRASTLNIYSIYMSKNNKESVSENLEDVYYAGSVAGILDGYKVSSSNPVTSREITNGYMMVRNVYVDTNRTMIGDTVGGAFGLVGERVYVDRVNVNVSGKLSGVQYSAGVAGENRGVIKNAEVHLGEGVFVNSSAVSSGVAGFNLGGLVQNAEAYGDIIKTSHGQIVAGIVGRNVYGTVADVFFDGQLFGYFTGGIVGADYDHDMFIMASVGSGAVHVDCRTNQNLIPSSEIQYTSDRTPINHYSNVSLSRKALDYLVDNSSKYYSYTKNTDDTNDLPSQTNKIRVLGLVVGLSYKTDVVMKNGNQYLINFDTTNKKITFNANTSENVAVEDITVTLKEDTVNSDNNVVIPFNNINVLNMSKGKAYIMYLVGAEAMSFDSWNGYSNEYVLVE